MLLLLLWMFIIEHAQSSEYNNTTTTKCGWWDTSGQHCPGILPHEGEAEATVHGGYNLI
jgi:hypothetical protein